jgi:hypothetical protein
VAYLFQRPGENLLPYLDAVGQVRLAAALRGARVTDAEIHDLLALVATFLGGRTAS